MKFLLKLKHWQLFLITWGLPILLNILTFSQPELMFLMFPVLMIFFTLGNFGWIWAIATELNHKIPTALNLNAARFKIYFAIPLIYTMGLSLYMAFSFSSAGGSTSMSGIVIAVLHLLSMACIFMGLRFAAKTMKTVELGRLAKFGDYAGEFFLMWFSVIGFWVLQPRLNKMVE
jgi:hypothetical protein